MGIEQSNVPFLKILARLASAREELEDMADIYGWVLESRDFGMVPHTAFGIGFKRV